MPLELKILKILKIRRKKQEKRVVDEAPLLFDDITGELTLAGKRYIREEFGELIKDDYDEAVRRYHLMEKKAQEYVLEKHHKFHPY